MKFHDWYWIVVIWLAKYWSSMNWAHLSGYCSTYSGPRCWANRLVDKVKQLESVSWRTPRSIVRYFQLSVVLGGGRVREEELVNLALYTATIRSSPCKRSTHMRTHIHTYTHVHTQTHTHVHTLTHVHTYTHTLTKRKRERGLTWKLDWNVSKHCLADIHSCPTHTHINHKSKYSSRVHARTPVQPNMPLRSRLVKGWATHCPNAYLLQKIPVPIHIHCSSMSWCINYPCIWNACTDLQ